MPTSNMQVQEVVPKQVEVQKVHDVQEVLITPPGSPRGGKPELKRKLSHHISLEEELMQHLSPDDQQILKEIDKDFSGIVEFHEIIGVLRQHREQKAATHRLFQVFGIAVLVLVILLGGNTVATFAVVENAKESHVQGESLVSASTGQTVQTANEDMSVDANGNLVSKAASRRLNGKGGSIKTTPSLEKVELASSLPDATLMGLDEVTVYSDKGHTLQIQVNGFSRVPVLNSNCGNVVHFYTAWKGRITLDSKDLSFDEATAKEFKNAGFSLATGGIGGRRLAGDSKADGFFKHMEAIKEKGSWKCAGVPLPSISKYNIRQESSYLPCGATLDGTKTKRKMDMCDSRFGGQVPGAGQLEGKHALAASSKTKRISALLAKSTPKAIYVKTTTTALHSKSYSVQIESYAAHMGQEKITITDLNTKAGITFQNVKGEGRSHCETTKQDAAQKNLDDADADKNTDSDMHFEFLGTAEEDGKVLRHFRLMTSDAFRKYMGVDGKQPTDAYTEYWDFAETLKPYRIVSGDGSVTVYDSITNECSDDDVKKTLAERNSVAIADLMTCSDEEKTAKSRPEMESPYGDLDAEGAGYYTDLTFKGEENMTAAAADTDDTTAKAAFARYIQKTENQLAMPDFCYEYCKTVVDVFKIDLENGANHCLKSLPQALDCLESSQMTKCESAEFVSNHRSECNATMNAAQVHTRRMEADESMELRRTEDGSFEASVSQFSMSFQDSLLQQLGGDALNNALLVFNGTKSPSALGSSKVRSLMSTNCNSKMGKVTWVGDGWCMKWEFKRFGFELMIKWGNVGGAIGVAIQCEACVPILLVFAIPPPLVVQMCVGGVLTVALKVACPQVPIDISGKVYFSIEAKADFGILSISFAKLEIGIFAGVGWFKIATRCWWICGEGRRRRRRWWSRRRRRTRACNYRSECDIKVGAYAEFTFAMFRVRLDVTYWIKNKVMTISVSVLLYEFWKLWWGGWKSVYSTVIARYKF